MERFTVACCQLRAHGIEEAEQNLEEIMAALDEAGRAGAQLVALPECSYPAYYLKGTDAYDRPGVRPYAEVEQLLAAKAREHGYWLAAGLAVPGDNGRLTNSGVVFTPGGEVAGRYDKTFLWHFDARWFDVGGRFPVFDAGFVRFGILICADSRQPEISRSLVANGAEMILDLTAWVSAGRTVAELATIQTAYMMPVRAWESGVWIACADKWGSEDGTIVYAGQSNVIDPRGEMRACAPSEGSTVLTFEVEPMRVERLLRRPSLYKTLTKPTDELPVTRLMDEPIVATQAERRVAVLPDRIDFNPRAIVARFEALRDQDTDLVIFPTLPGPEGWQPALSSIEQCVKARGGAVAFGVDTGGCTAHFTGVLVTPEQTVEHLATHGRGIQLGESPAPVVPTAAGNVGLMVADEGEAPEVARALALNGAEILAWTLPRPGRMTEPVARTRSDENRVYTAVAWPDGGLITAPGGAVQMTVPAGTGVAMADTVNLALSRAKTRAPGTNVILNRVPEAYGALLK